ncbi:hypothetical protein Tco_0940539 [Tanacetum coccineum]|uniref:Uncharacterized protein n=1 Tax=Tanacetum coccineum TaxID=301880 RepID=A0ABQ5DV16_9ASTR
MFQLRTLLTILQVLQTILHNHNTYHTLPYKRRKKNSESRKNKWLKYWKIPICYDDDEDDTIAITPVLPIEEPDNSLSMEDEHLDTIPATESDEVIKSSVEDLVLIPNDIIREKLLNVNLLIAKIDALRDNPTPSSDVIEPDPGDLTSIDPGIRKNVSTTNVNVPLEDDQSSLFAYVVWIFLSFLTYPVAPPYLLSTGNEDTIFPPAFSI